MIPSLIGQHMEFKGIGWKESAIDVVLSSIGQYCNVLLFLLFFL